MENRPMEIQDVMGEALYARERLVVSPARGVFFPSEALTGDQPTAVTEGQPIGHIAVRGAAEAPVVSCWHGALLGFLAFPGERVRPGQPIAWMRAE